MPKEDGLYLRDFVLWAESQAKALREAAHAGSNLPLDWDNLAEEVESLGRSRRRELKSCLANLAEHLLKLELSPAVEPRPGWIETVGRERRENELLLEDSPSLKGEVEPIASAIWRPTARLVAEVLSQRGELSSEDRSRIEAARYTARQLLGDWFPDRAS